MKIAILYMAVGLFILPFVSIGQPVFLTELKQNTIQRKEDSIFIVGCGSLEIRAFLDILSTHFIDKLASRKVHARYMYIGQDTSPAGPDWDSMANNDYPVILFIVPTDTLHNLSIDYKRRNNYLEPFLGRQPYPAYKRDVAFKHTFELQLFEVPLHAESFWRASLHVDCDISQNKSVASISKLIIESLVRNRIID